jgi:enoyl-CoA hydratase
MHGGTPAWQDASTTPRDATEPRIPVTIATETHDDVRLIRIDAPERRNALDLERLTGLAHALREADEDADVRAIVLTGADPAFSAGLDLKAVGSGELDLAAVQEDGDGDPWRVLSEMATPTIAAVNGPAVTGGLELVLGCDLAIASEQAAFADTHARVGIHPSGGMTVLLPRYVGLRDALGMSLTGRFVGAEEARTMGLVNAVVPHGQLIEEALSWARSIAEADAGVLGAIRSTYRELDGLSRPDAHAREREIGLAMAVDAGAVEERRAAVIERGRGLRGG